MILELPCPLRLVALLTVHSLHNLLHLCQLLFHLTLLSGGSGWPQHFFFLIFTQIYFPHHFHFMFYGPLKHNVPKIDVMLLKVLGPVVMVKRLESGANSLAVTRGAHYFTSTGLVACKITELQST